MSDETTLLPCPFCGGEAHMSASSDGYSVQCWNRRCIDMQMEEIPTEAEAIAAWNTRAATTIGKLQVEIEPVVRGTLTAEQVRKAILAGSVYASYDGAQYYANGINMQAIADELNARAERTCEFKPFKSGTNEEGERQGICSVCSAYMHEQFCFCPNCGCKVVDA